MSLLETAESDLDTFFDTDGFAILATLSGGESIKIIKGSSFSETLGIENVDLEIVARYSEVSALVQNSTITIGGVTYYVMRTPIDDGSGIASIPLSKSQV